MPTSEQDLTIGTGRRFIHPSLLAVPANSDITNDNFSGIGIGYSDDGDDAPDEDSGGETSCEIALGECSAARAELEEENENLQGENDDLNNAVDSIIDDGIPADSQGVIVSNQCTLTLDTVKGVQTDGYNTGQLKYARAGGAGNYIEAKSPSTLWSETYGIDPAGGPNFGVGPPFCALRIVGNGYVGGWEPNPNTRMDFAGLHQAGDTATVEGRFIKNHPDQTVSESAFAIFTFTATSPTSLVVTNDIGSTYNQDDRPVT